VAQVAWAALRAPQGQMRDVATNSMPDILEEPQRSRWPCAAATLRAAGVCARMLCCSSSQWVSIASSSRLACGRRSRAARPAGLLPRAARVAAQAAALLLLIAIRLVAQPGVEHWQRGQTALKAGSYEEAESEFRKFIQAAPAVGEAHVNLGLALHLQRKNSEAVESFRRAIKLRPTLANAHLFLGIDLFNLNKTNEAIVSLSRYTQMAPRDPQGHYYLGLSHAARGERQKAIRSFEAAVDLSPKDVDMLYHLAQAYINQANAIVQRVAEHDPKLSLLRKWEDDQKAGIGDAIRQSPVATAD
jgi:tetratricopeptide (TPR) repeat protein